MRLKDTYDTFEQAFNYPVDSDTVVEHFGDTAIESPHGSNETVAEILGREQTETYASPRTLFDAFAGSVSDGYIGRKFYDDRGDNVPAADN